MTVGGGTKTPDLVPRSVVWARLGPTEGREQDGMRPVVVVSGSRYLQVVTDLAIVVPVTSRERGWTNHVPLEGPHGLSRSSWAMTEQPRTLSRSRLVRVSGAVDTTTFDTIRQWLGDFLRLELPTT